MQMNTYDLNALATTLVRSGHPLVHLGLDDGVGHGGYVSAELVFAKPDSARS
jgi:hypothetical protein